jgi:hypothetical protein
MKWARNGSYSNIRIFGEIFDEYSTQKLFENGSTIVDNTGNFMSAALINFQLVKGCQEYRS